MLCDVARVLELRLILRQPSPLWVSFTVEELQVYQQGAKVRDSLSWWPALSQGGLSVAGRAGGGVGVGGQDGETRGRPSWKLASWESRKLMRGTLCPHMPLIFAASHLLQSRRRFCSLCPWGPPSEGLRESDCPVGLCGPRAGFSQCSRRPGPWELVPGLSPSSSLFAFQSPSMTFPKWLSHPAPCEQPAPLLEVSPHPG